LRDKSVSFGFRGIGVQQLVERLIAMPGRKGTIEWGRLLSSRRRVLIAAYLLKEADETPIDVGDLVTGVAKMEADDPGPVDSEFRHSVHTTSLQHHLSALDAADVIELKNGSQVHRVALS